MIVKTKYGLIAYASTRESGGGSCYCINVESGSLKFSWLWPTQYLPF